MRILIIGNIRRQQGGITTQILELRDSFESEGVAVQIVSTHGRITDRIKSVFKAYRYSREIDMILGVGCAYYGFLPMLVASVISKISRKKVLYNFHDGQASEFLKKYAGLMKLFLADNKIIVATGFLADSFRRFGFNPVVINNHFNDVRMRDKEKRNSGPIKVMWARSYEQLYRADIALEGAVRVLKKCDAEFHFYGGGSLKDYYREKYGGFKGIFFHDFLERGKLLEEYSKFDVFVNTTDFDNFPMSIVEAGMNGLTVLTSDAEGTASIYTGDDVMFFRKGSLEDYVSKLETLVSGFNDYSYLADNLRKKVSGFSWGSVRAKWISLVNETAK